MGEANAGLGQCKSLHTLDIYGNKVTTKGVEMALENLPDLKYFDCNQQIQVLAELLRGPPRKNLRCLPNLTFLRNNGSKLDQLCERGDIELVAATCCSVNKVHIDAEWFIMEEETPVLELQKLKRLCELHIEGDDRRFNGGILPLLKHFSSSLTSLSFYHLHSPPVNIRAIVENCPKLQTLNISYCKFSPPQQLEDEPNPSKRLKTNLELENLKSLKLHFCDDLTVEDLDLLLASPALEELSLYSVRFPIDDCLRTAANLHQFRNLKHLQFGLVGVTKAGIDLLMNDGNPLKVIELFFCQLLKVSDIEEWKGVALEKNWDVVFQFKYNNSF